MTINDRKDSVTGAHGVTGTQGGNGFKKMRSASGEPAGQVTETRLRSNVGEIKSFFKTIAIFLIAAIILRASVVEAFKIPSGSMIPTLQIGDHILVSKFNYGLRIPLMREVLYQMRLPERGDVVVFTLPDDLSTPHKDEGKINIIKRVIGLPGDTVEVRYGKVYLNNKEYQESYARFEEGGLGTFHAEVVPPGHVFLLGDNRDKSRDARFWPEPFLDVRRIKGKALIVYWSWHSFSRIGKTIH